MSNAAGEDRQPPTERTTARAKDHYSGGPSRSAIIFAVLGLIAGLVVGFFVLKLMSDSDADAAAVVTATALPPAPAQSLMLVG